MPAGLVTYTDAGIVQIDSDFKSFSLVKKGTVSLATNANSVTISTTGAKAPLLFIRPVGDAVAVGKFTYADGGTATWSLQRVPGGEYPYRGPYGAATQISYWVFDEPQAIQDVSPGLTLYTPDGRVAYNSNSPELKITQVLTSPASTYWNNPGYQSVVATIAEGFAVCVSAPKMYLVGQPTEAQCIVWVQGIGFIGTTMRSPLVECPPTPSTPWLPDGTQAPINPAVSYIYVADVRNM